jgi:hypothetical protein
MKAAVRILMWTHFVYLLLLPTLSVIAAVMMFGDEDLWAVILIAGFPPVVMYSLFLANGYTIPDSLPVAIFVVLAIPLQIAASILLFGSGSLWLFFAENAAVEIGAFVVGVMTVALRNRQMEFSGSLTLILLLPVVLFVGGVIPQFISVFYGYGGPSLWMLFFVTAFVTAFWNYTKVYKKLTTAYRKKGEPQNLEMRFDSTLASKLFGVPHNVPLLSPVWKKDEPTARSCRVWAFGFTAMFLPILGGGIASALY